MVLAVRATDQPYQPATKPEKLEFANDRLDVYPDDVRKNPTNFAGVPMVWAGIIRSIDATEEDTGSKIRAKTVFEHHYFDWVEDKGGRHLQLAVSPRGEGMFRATWFMNKTVFDATAADAEKFAAPGDLVIFYGQPEKVDADGTVDMRYRYLRVIDRDHFNTNEFDYGRLGEPFYTIHPADKSKAPAAPQK